MAISITNLTQGLDTDGNSTATTASITPSSNNLILLTVISRTAISTDPNQPTATGNSLTYVVEKTTVYDTTSSSRRRITTFRALGSAPTAGTIAIDFGGQNQTDVLWFIDQVSGIDTSGANGAGAIVQSVANQVTTITTNSLTVTLAAFGSTANATYGAFADSGFTWTEGSGFTRLARYPNSDALDNLSGMTEWKTTNDTSVDGTTTNNSELGGIALELKAEVIAFGYRTLLGVGK